LTSATPAAYGRERVNHPDDDRDLERRKVKALETLAREAGRLSAALELIARHLITGTSPEELEELRREAATLARDLGTDRAALGEALEESDQPPTGKKQ
jgi:hypothetical protein